MVYSTDLCAYRAREQRENARGATRRPKSVRLKAFGDSCALTIETFMYFPLTRRAYEIFEFDSDSEKNFEILTYVHGELTSTVAVSHRGERDGKRLYATDTIAVTSHGD